MSHDVSTAAQEANNHHFEGWLGKLEKQHGMITKLAIAALVIMALIFLGVMILVDRPFVIAFADAASASASCGLIVFLVGVIVFFSDD